MNTAFTAGALAALSGLVLASALHAQTPAIVPAPARANIKTKVPPPPARPQHYSVILHAPSLAAAVANARAQGRTLSDAEQKAHVAKLRAAQDALSAQIAAHGGTEITRTSKSLNAVFITADAATARKLASLSAVRNVQRVMDMKTHATEYKEVVPHIGSDRRRAAGNDGTGVRVAVLDSGIDYTHAAFGGPGTAAAYLAAYGKSPEDAANTQAPKWPQGRVIGGYDFLGEAWPNDFESPDGDPIGAPPWSNALGIQGTDGSHGTSVADILAGGPFPGRPDNHGVAPKASLYAVKVCSAVGPYCSGMAIIQGIDFALDPNGDGSLSDAVDVINLSLGADFGQRENPTVEATINAVRVGVVVCAAAGNAADVPYILSSPACAPEVIAVAQTDMPSERPWSAHQGTSVTWSSSRGPAVTTQAIKPEIAAPGANLAAVAGSGTAFEPFGGTSGATPVVAGVAALLRQQFPKLSPLEVKARIMNHAARDIYRNAYESPGVLAPISRVGAGEVRAKAACETLAAAWVVGPDGAPSSPALAFGYWRLSAPQTFTQTVRVRNLAGTARVFNITTESRDAARQPGAVTLTAPASVRVPAGGTADFNVALTVVPEKLAFWSTDSGYHAADADLFATHEFGGFVTLSEGADTLALPWHVLPHRSHRGLVSTTSYTLGAAAPKVSNTGSTMPAQATVFALTGTSGRLPAGSYPAPGDNYAVTDLANVGVRLVNYGATYGLGLQFALTTWDRRTQADYPAYFEIGIDTDLDGTSDWFLNNQAFDSFNSDWRNATFLRAAPWWDAFGLFFTSVQFNSANVVLEVPLNRLSTPPPSDPITEPFAVPLSANKPFAFTVRVYDNYFSGQLNDELGPMIYTPASPKYVINGNLGTLTVPAGGQVTLPITATGSKASPSQTGVLLLFDHGRTRYESHAIKVTP